MTDITDLKKKVAPILRDGPPNVGELVLVWIAGVVAYAIITKLEPFYMQGWYDLRFLTLRRLPPQEHEWRVKDDHLQGNEFTIDGHPVCIMALDLSTLIKQDESGEVTELTDTNVIKLQSWKEMMDERRKKDDGGDDDDCGGGCGDKCPSSCS